MDRLEEHEIGYLEGIVARYGWAYHDYYSNADVSVDADDVKTLEKAIELIKAIPTAEPYKGMTKGEIMHKLFPNDCFVVGEYGFDEKWWNSPYEPQESEEV